MLLWSFVSVIVISLTFAAAMEAERVRDWSHLVGKPGHEAVETIKKQNPDLNVHAVKHVCEIP